MSRFKSLITISALALVAGALTAGAPASAVQETASAAAVSACGKFQQRANSHARKARAFDRKAMALRGKAQRSEKAERRFDRFRKLTRRHARKQERNNRRYTVCKLRRIRGSYEGTLEDSPLPVSFTVSDNGKWVTGFRAQVAMECRGQDGAEPTALDAELVLDERIAVGEAGEFRAETDTRADPAYVVSGRLRDGRAAGVLAYSTGSLRDLESEYCRAPATRWSAERG